MAPVGKKVVVANTHSAIGVTDCELHTKVWQYVKTMRSIVRVGLFILMLP